MTLHRISVTVPAARWWCILPAAAAHDLTPPALLRTGHTDRITPLAFEPAGVFVLADGTAENGVPATAGPELGVGN
jgi:hypothetical protein